MVGTSMRVLVVTFASFMLAASAAFAEPAKKNAPAPAPAPTASVAVVQTTKPSADYEAETYSGVPLDGDYAKERGLSKGLVFMVFEKQRRATFRVSKDRIKKVVKMIAEDVAPVMLVKAAPTSRSKIDVVETEGGVFLVETVTANAGIFTTSDVYAFARGSTHADRVAALSRVPTATRRRLERALVLAEAATVK
jgi:hypothetical protein